MCKSREISAFLYYFDLSHWYTICNYLEILHLSRTCSAYMHIQKYFKKILSLDIKNQKDISVYLHITTCVFSLNKVSKSILLTKSGSMFKNLRVALVLVREQFFLSLISFYYIYFLHFLNIKILSLRSIPFTA